MLNPAMFEDVKGVREILKPGNIMAKFVSFLRCRTPAERAQHLQTIADILHRRSSMSDFDRLIVCHCEPAGKFCIERYRDTNPAHKFDTYRAAMDYIRKFYRNLLIEGDADAPNDIFLDALKAVTKKKSND